MVKNLPTLDFKIHGMDCAEEVGALKREVGPAVGGESRISFDILNGRMTVVQGPGGVSPQLIMKAVARTGMRAEIWRDREQVAEQGTFWQRRGQTVLAVASGLFGMVGFLAHAWTEGRLLAAFGTDEAGVIHPAPLAMKGLYALSILTGVWFFLPKAWQALRRLRPDMNLLMTVAVCGAVAIGEWFEAATVAFLFAVSLSLESWSIGRARRAVAALMNLTPSTVRLQRADGGEELLAPEQVPAGSLFIVRPGERIPLDGRVIRGTSEVNQAPITGESAPVPKKAGEEVFAGTINGDGALTVECTRPSSDTTLANIIRLISDAQSRRAPSEQWVERFARVYTPAVMGIALAAMVIPPLFFGEAWQDWFYRSLVLLVIACPCALVISTPVSIVAALAASARNGVLIKGGLYVEAPARLDAIALDKTGTLTEGKPTVVEVVPFNGHDEKELLERAAALEAHSTHPLARAVVTYAKLRAVEACPAEDLQIIQGKGATAHIDGQAYWLGSPRFLDEHGQGTTEVHQRLDEMAKAGHTVVIIGNANHVCGLIALTDAVRPGVRQVLQALRGAGIKHVVMLTGDNQRTADAIAQETGVDEVHANLLPADKMTLVEALVTKYGRVAMVGDGVNDAPALARATLGIAMGAVGSDAAIETADIALMSDDLSKLPWMIRHSRRTLTIIRQNICFSLSVKMLFVVLTFAGYASLWAAIVADMGASLLVIFNGLRLLNSASSN